MIKRQKNAAWPSKLHFLNKSPTSLILSHDTANLAAKLLVKERDLTDKKYEQQTDILPNLDDDTVAYSCLAVNLADLSVTVMEVEQRDLLVNLLYKVTNKMAICSYTRAVAKHTTATLKFFSSIIIIIIIIIN